MSDNTQLIEAISDAAANATAAARSASAAAGNASKAALAAQVAGAGSSTASTAAALATASSASAALSAAEAAQSALDAKGTGREWRDQQMAHAQTLGTGIDSVPFFDDLSLPIAPSGEFTQSYQTTYAQWLAGIVVNQAQYPSGVFLLDANGDGSNADNLAFIWSQQACGVLNKSSWYACSRVHPDGLGTTADTCAGISHRCLYVVGTSSSSPCSTRSSREAPLPPGLQSAARLWLSVAADTAAV